MSVVTFKKKTYEFRIIPFNTILGSIFVEAFCEREARDLVEKLGIDDLFKLVGEVMKGDRY